MTLTANRHLEAIWTRFFIQETFHSQDPRNKVISLFCRSFSALNIPLETSPNECEAAAHINVPDLQTKSGVSDLCKLLAEQPDSLLNCMVFRALS